MLVEVCCNSLESALNAQKAGADRIELCCELGVGGITPSYGLIKLVKERLAIPIHVLIRPRSGHFTYSDLEFEVILNEIEVCKNIGVDGVVCGILMSDGEIDIERTKRIIENTKPLHFTFHRAFDWIKNQENALLQLERLGVDTILTSGKQINAKSGFKVLTKLNKLAKVITIMPGGGIIHKTFERRPGSCNK